MNLKKLKKEIESLVAKANFVLREDVHALLESAYYVEKNKKAKTALWWILENANTARAEKIAICQDTGLPVVFLEIGRDINVTSSLIDVIKEGVEFGYKNNYLRPSIVDPCEREMSSYKGIIYHLDFCCEIKGLKVTIFPKGFGSENKSQLKMFNPTVSFDEIEEFIVDTVRKAGPESCPPFVIGLGVGGTADRALLLAKKALLSDVSKSNPNKMLNVLEKKLLKKINSLKIGPMGMGGNTTCLAVKIKKSFTHIAGLPVGINISCHALRSATLNIARIKD